MRLIFFLLIMLCFFYSADFTSGCVYNNAQTRTLTLSTDLNPTFNYTLNQTAYCPDTNANLNIIFNLTWGANSFYALTYYPSNAHASGNGVLETTPVNWLSNSRFTNLIWYYDSCSFSTTNCNYACTNHNTGAGCTVRGTNDFGSCTKDIVSEATYTSFRTLTYTDNDRTETGNGTVAAFCNGTIYINNVAQGEISSAGTPVNIPIPINQSVGNYSVPVSINYSCFFAAKRNISVNNNLRSDRTTLYNHFSDTYSVNVPIPVVGAAGIDIIGAAPVPVVFTNNTAFLNIIIRNNGTVPINLTRFNLSQDFIFIPTDVLPIALAPGQARTVGGNINYTGAGLLPENLTITAFANTSAVVCTGSAEVNASHTIAISQGGNLVPKIRPKKYPMNQTEKSSANIIVTNIGSEDIIQYSLLNVTIKHCNSRNSSDCPKENSSSVSVPPIPANETYLYETEEYKCEGYSFILIEARANADGSVNEPTGDNMDSEYISCLKENCKITGPNEITLPGEYNFSAVCYEGATPKNCSDILGSNHFIWNYAPASNASLNYTTTSSGVLRANSTIQFFNITNATLIINIESTDNKMECNYTVLISENACAQQI